MKTEAEDMHANSTQLSHLSYLEQRVEGHIFDIFVHIEEETAKNVDGQHPQARLALDVHDGQHRLIQDSIPHIFGGFGVSGNLQKHSLENGRK